MEPTERKHLRVDIVDGTAVVRFVNTDIIFAEGVVQEVGDQLLSLVEDQGYNQLVLDLSGVRYLSSSRTSCGSAGSTGSSRSSRMSTVPSGCGTRLRSRARARARAPARTPPR